MQGYYHYGEDAWGYVYDQTGVDLKALLETIAVERVNQ
jgi:hypothetical protein